jgi:uncharacterized protein (TIGR02145 family)
MNNLLNKQYKKLTVYSDNNISIFSLTALFFTQAELIKWCKQRLHRATYLNIVILLWCFGFVIFPSRAQLDKSLEKAVNQLKLNLKNSSLNIPTYNYCADGVKTKRMIGATMDKGFSEEFLDQNLNLYASRMREIVENGDTYFCNIYEEIMVIDNSVPYSIDTIELLYHSGFIDWKIVAYAPAVENPYKIKEGHIIYFPKGLFYSKQAMPRSYTSEFILTISPEMHISTCYKVNTSDGDAYLLEFKNDIEYKYCLVDAGDLTSTFNRFKSKELGFFIDQRDNQSYKYAKIDDLYWMAENLKFKLSEGTVQNSIPGSVKPQENYYNYFEALSACPKGWHLPSDSEWKKLESYAGVSEDWIDYIGSDYSRGDGVTMKNIGFELVNDKKLSFLAEYTGFKTQYGSQQEVGNLTYYWTRTKYDEVNSIIRVLGVNFPDGIIRDKTGIQNLFSCRCVKDRDSTYFIEIHPKFKDYFQKEMNGQMTADDFYSRSIEFLSLGEDERSLQDIESALSIEKDNLEYKLFKAQILNSIKFDKEAPQIRAILNEYLSKINDNEFAYYLAFMAELYDYNPKIGLEATRDNLRKQKALSYLNKAILLDPKNPYYLEFKSKMQLSEMKYSDAIKVINTWIGVDPKNGEAYYLLGMATLKNLDSQNKVKKISAPEWCGMISGCYKVTAVQLKEICGYFTKAINYGYNINPDYYSLCGELKAAEVLEQHQPIIHVGPRGGRYTISTNGNKIYIPKR